MELLALPGLSRKEIKIKYWHVSVERLAQMQHETAGSVILPFSVCTARPIIQRYRGNSLDRRDDLTKLNQDQICQWNILVPRVVRVIRLLANLFKRLSYFRKCPVSSA